MADYDWGPDCGCGFMQPHHRLCENNPNYELNKNIDHEIAQARAKGFVYIGTADTDGLGRQQMLWGCRRGCGTVVWHLEDHIKNVCRKFEPVVGQAGA